MIAAIAQFLLAMMIGVLILLAVIGHGKQQPTHRLNGWTAGGYAAVEGLLIYLACGGSLWPF